MFKVAFLHFADGAAGPMRSGWYVTSVSGAVVERVGRFEHQAGAIRAASALVNASAFA